MTGIKRLALVLPPVRIVIRCDLIFFVIFFSPDRLADGEDAIRLGLRKQGGRHYIMPAANTVTLDNLSQKLPQWRPDEQNHLYAVVDMGRLVA